MTVILNTGFGIASWNFECIGRPRNYAITCGFKPTSSGMNPNDAADSLNNAITTAGAPCADPANMLNSYRYLGVTVTYQTPLGPVGGTKSVSITGTASAGGMPPNAAYLVRKATLRGGRQGRGRMYVPPFNLSELSVDSMGYLGGGTITSLTAQWRAFLAGAAAETVPLYLLHSEGKGGIFWSEDVIQDVYVESQVATQRRRLRK